MSTSKRPREDDNDEPKGPPNKKPKIRPSFLCPTCNKIVEKLSSDNTCPFCNRPPFCDRLCLTHGEFSTATVGNIFRCPCIGCRHMIRKRCATCHRFISGTNLAKHTPLCQGAPMTDVEPLQPQTALVTQLLMLDDLSEQDITEWVNTPVVSHIGNSVFNNFRNFGLFWHPNASQYQGMNITARIDATGEEFAVNEESGIWSVCFNRNRAVEEWEIIHFYANSVFLGFALVHFVVFIPKGGAEEYYADTNFEPDESLLSKCTKVSKHTALHLAARLGYMELAVWLLENGANMYAQTIKQQIPRDIALESNHLELYELLVELEEALYDPIQKHVPLCQSHTMKFVDEENKKQVIQDSLNEQAKGQQTPSILANPMLVMCTVCGLVKTPQFEAQVDTESLEKINELE